MSNKDNKEKEMVQTAEMREFLILFQSLTDAIEQLEKNIDTYRKANLVPLEIGKITGLIKTDNGILRPGLQFIWFGTADYNPWLDEMFGYYIDINELGYYGALDDIIIKAIKLERKKFITHGENISIYRYRNMQKLKRDKARLVKEMGHINNLNTGNLSFATIS